MVIADRDFEGFDRTDGYTAHGGPSTAVTAGREKDFCGREKMLRPWT